MGATPDSRRCAGAVRSIEADAANGRISTAAPIGRALVGQRSGAEVDVVTPRGRVLLKVLEVAGTKMGARAEGEG